MKSNFRETMLTEGKLSDKAINSLVKKIAKMTDRNDHNGSVLELAKALKHKVAIDTMDLIILRHKRDGEMSGELIDRRRKVTNILYDTVKKHYGNDVYKKIYGAF